MSVLHASKVLSKLERIIEFRLGSGVKYKPPIVLQPDSVIYGRACPSTDGNRVFLPRKEKHFASERDNELSLANSSAHESDHIRELEEYFGAEVEGLRAKGVNLVEEFHQRNFSGLTENPALAGWIDNIVKDRRVDAQRREQMPGVERYYREVQNPAAEYFRPSTKGMPELDAFRELFLQRALIDRTIEPVPEKYRALLDEVIGLSYRAGSIHDDKEVVAQIYQKLKEHFDITRPISRLPSFFGTGDHSQPSSGQPQQGYGKEVKPREGRGDKEKKPKKLDGEKGKLYKPNEDKPEDRGNKNDKNEKDEGIENQDNDRTSLYQQAQDKYGIRIHVVEPQFTDEMTQREEGFRDRYAGEIESMKRIFRQLKLKHYGDKRDFQGQELSYEDYMQSELESRVTGIKGTGRYFRRDTQNEQRPAWAVLADITPSTEQHKILEQIRAGLFINAEALGVTDWPMGLFGFSNNVLYVINDFPERYGPTSSNKIMALKREDSGGTYLGSPLRTVGSLLKRQTEHPKGITIITDGEDQNLDDAKAAMREVYDQKMYPFLIIIGREFEGYAKFLTADIGEEHYSVIDRDKIHELPGEIFRLFKTYGITR